MKIFIQNNISKLAIIKNTIKDVDWKFDVPIESRLNKKVAVQCDYIDAELIRLCAELNIGIELSYYPTVKASLWKIIKRKFA